jgi:hypothetical protein
VLLLKLKRKRFQANEEPVEDKAEETPKKEENIDESTAEVKGATSDEKEAEKEKE